MLGIVLLILKILLWIILGILGLLLLLILMVLFVPIRYKVAGSKYDTLIAKGAVTYLLRLIRVEFDYKPEGYAYKVKVLFFTVLSDEQTTQPKKSDSETDLKAKDGVSFDGIDEMEVDEFLEMLRDEKTEEGHKKKLARESDKLKAEVEALEKEKLRAEEKLAERDRLKAEHREAVRQRHLAEVKKEQTKTEQLKAPKEQLEVSSVTRTDLPSDKAKKTKKPQKAKKPKREKKVKESPSALDQAKAYYTFLRTEENIGVLRYIIKRLFKAIKSVLPKRFRGKVHFGLDDPAMTGFITGGANMLYHKYKKSLTITPNFQETLMEGEGELKGRIIPGVFVYQAIRIILDRRVRRLIRYVRQQQQEG